MESAAPAALGAPGARSGGIVERHRLGDSARGAPDVARAIARTLLSAMLILLALMVVPRAASAAITVDSAADFGAASDCELRDAIRSANDNVSVDGCSSGEPGHDTIDFDIAPDGLGSHKITPASPSPPLPQLNDPVTIDGELTDPDEIVIEGTSLTGGGDGLILADGSAGSTIRGLTVVEFLPGADGEGDGLRIDSGENLVEEVRVGTNAADLAGVGNADDGIDVRGAGNTIRNSVVSGNGGDGISVDGSQPGPSPDENVIEGNRVGTTSSGGAALANTGVGVRIDTAADTEVGGTGAGEGNVISANGFAGVFDFLGDGTAIRGNLIGTDAAGTSALANTHGVFLQAANARVGGSSAAARNVISGNSFAEVRVSGTAATGNRVESNYIGTDSAGSADVGTAEGVRVESGADDNVVGSPGAGNVISGNVFGVTLLNAGTSGNKVQSNLIGTAAGGSAMLPNDIAGVFIFQASDNTVGGPGAGQGNVIAHAALSGPGQGFGVEVDGPAATGNAILRNSIRSNATLGIDLAADGLTANDPGDADAGPNDLQNFPDIATARTNSVETSVLGSLGSRPNRTFRVELFSSPSCDPSGSGEGRTFLGARNATTNGAGVAQLDVAVSPSAVGDQLTATATDLTTDDTSEFSACVQIVSKPEPSPPPQGMPPAGDADPPETTITKGPKRKLKTRKRKAKAKLKFESDEPGSNFECRIKGKGAKRSLRKWHQCESPWKKKLNATRKARKHVFRVRATDPAGNTDPSPAKRKWKLKRKRGRR